MNDHGNYQNYHDTLLDHHDYFIIQSIMIHHDEFMIKIFHFNHDDIMIDPQ